MLKAQGQICCDSTLKVLKENQQRIQKNVHSSIMEMDSIPVPRMDITAVQ